MRRGQGWKGNTWVKRAKWRRCVEGAIITGVFVILGGTPMLFNHDPGLLCYLIPYILCLQCGIYGHWIVGSFGSVLLCGMCGILFWHWFEGSRLPVALWWSASKASGVHFKLLSKCSRSFNSARRFPIVSPPLNHFINVSRYSFYSSYPCFFVLFLSSLLLSLLLSFVLYCFYLF